MKKLILISVIILIYSNRNFCQVSMQQYEKSQIKTINATVPVKTKLLATVAAKPGDFSENTPMIIAAPNANGNNASISFNTVGGALSDLSDAKYYLFDCDYDGKDNLLVINLNDRSIQQNSLRVLSTNVANAVTQTGEFGFTSDIKLQDDIYFGDFSPGTGKSFIVYKATRNEFWHYQHNSTTKMVFERPYPMLSNWVAYAKYASGDFNGDGKTDLLAWDVNRNEFHVALYTKNPFSGLGEASLQPTGIWLSGWAQSTEMNMVTGDFNGDRKDDIAIVHQPTGEWWVALSNGTGFQPSPGYKSGVWLKPWGIGKNQKLFATDLNSDGKCDLFRYDYNEKSFQAVLSNGQYFDYFLKKEYITSTITNPMQVAFGKFNGHGIIVIGHELPPDAQYRYPRRSASIYLTNYKRL